MMKKGKKEKRKKGILYRHLKQGLKRYLKGKRTKAEVIMNAVSIGERPAIVDTKKRFGDWEIDTVLDKYGTISIVTLLERKTRFYKEGRLKISQRCDPSYDRAIGAV
jgi:IS30 family transposase